VLDRGRIAAEVRELALALGCALGRVASRVEPVGHEIDDARLRDGLLARSLVREVMLGERI